jgi:hypothetical protein
MRDYAKTGGKVGRPAYRTPSSFLAKKIFEKIRYQSQKIQKFLFKSQKWPRKKEKNPLLADTKEKR